MFFSSYCKTYNFASSFREGEIKLRYFFTKTERWRLFLFNPLVYSWTINFMLRIKITHFVGNKYEAASPNGQVKTSVYLKYLQLNFEKRTDETLIK